MTAKFESIDDEVVVDGFTLRAKIEPDSDHGPPWEEEDGHGPVSDWTTRSKKPGERVLCQDRGSYRYYDFQGAVETALKEGWNAPPYDQGSKRQKAARAVERDFENLKDWCEDRWCYVGVVLSVSRGGYVLDDCAASLWGIESDSDDYHIEVANELLDEALDCGRKALETILAAKE